MPVESYLFIDVIPLFSTTYKYEDAADSTIPSKKKRFAEDDDDDSPQKKKKPKLEVKDEPDENGDAVTNGSLNAVVPCLF